MSRESFGIVCILLSILIHEFTLQYTNYHEMYKKFILCLVEILIGTLDILLLFLNKNFSN